MMMRITNRNSENSVENTGNKCINEINDTHVRYTWSLERRCTGYIHIYIYMQRYIRRNGLKSGV